MQYSEGLKKSGDFSLVYEKGRSRGNSLLVLYVLPNGRDINRLGIVVSKKVGNSVVRHRLRRLVRESYRLSEESFERGYDLVVIVRRGAAGCDYHTINDRFLGLCRSFAILKTETEGPV